MTVIANILDPIHDTLPADVWLDAGSPEPKLKRQHRKWIEHTITRILTEAGYTHVNDWLSLVLTGSLTTYQYSANSDCDISLFVDAETFPEWSRAEMIGLMVEKCDGLKLPGTPYQMQMFVVASGITKEQLYQPGLRSGYDLDEDRWISPPEHDRIHNVEQEMNAQYAYALECADKMERLLRYEPDKAVQFWHQIHHRRQRDQRAGKGDFSDSNIVYKFLANRGLMPSIAEASGEYIAAQREAHHLDNGIWVADVGDETNGSRVVEVDNLTHHLEDGRILPADELDRNRGHTSLPEISAASGEFIDRNADHWEELSRAAANPLEYKYRTENGDDENATTTPWEHGHVGKAYVTNDGQVVHWKVNEQSEPHHYAIADMLGHEPRSLIPYIWEDGTVVGLGHRGSPSDDKLVADTIGGHLERGYDFNKFAVNHKQVAKFAYDPIDNHLVVGRTAAEEGEAESHYDIARNMDKTHGLRFGQVDPLGRVEVFSRPKIVGYGKEPMNQYEADWRLAQALKSGIPGAKMYLGFDLINPNWEANWTQPKVEFLYDRPVINATGQPAQAEHTWDFEKV